MVRIVRTPRDAVVVDETGKMSGRGAYLCRMWRCWEHSLKRDRLSHALKTGIAPEYASRLWEYAERFKMSDSAVSA